MQHGLRDVYSSRTTIRGASFAFPNVGYRSCRGGWGYGHDRRDPNRLEGGRMNVLIACEFSGVVRDAFRRRGHEAWSCDLEGVEPEGDWPNYHLEGDCRLFLDGSSGPCDHWDLMIAHPPCTYLANSGVRWLWNDGNSQNGRNYDRLKLTYEAARFFVDLWQAPIPRIAIENPIMHGYGQSYIVRHIRGKGMPFVSDRFPPTQIVQPWMFGHGESKAVCLWLKELPKLQPTDIVDGREPRVHWAAPGVNRWKERSRTLRGIGNAMAEQWGSL
jgi:hypothetical protein